MGIGRCASLELRGVHHQIGPEGHVVRIDARVPELIEEAPGETP